uniref:Uncharacterized protein n=1 Tax=Arundo donax TaxID=35708 RepID=A0A0A8Y599_ARUDO
MFSVSSKWKGVTVSKKENSRRLIHT